MENPWIRMDLSTSEWQNLSYGEAQVTTLLRKFKGEYTLWQIAVKTDIPNLTTRYKRIKINEWEAIL